MTLTASFSVVGRLTGSLTGAYYEGLANQTIATNSGNDRLLWNDPLYRISHSNGTTWTWNSTYQFDNYRNNTPIGLQHWKNAAMVNSEIIVPTPDLSGFLSGTLLAEANISGYGNFSYPRYVNVHASPIGSYNWETPDKQWYRENSADGPEWAGFWDVVYAYNNDPWISSRSLSEPYQTAASSAFQIVNGEIVYVNTLNKKPLVVTIASKSLNYPEDTDSYTFSVDVFRSMFDAYSGKLPRITDPEALGVSNAIFNYSELPGAGAGIIILAALSDYGLPTGIGLSYNTWNGISESNAINAVPISGSGVTITPYAPDIYWSPFNGFTSQVGTTPSLPISISFNSDTIVSISIRIFDPDWYLNTIFGYDSGGNFLTSAGFDYDSTPLVLTHASASISSSTYIKSIILNPAPNDFVTYDCLWWQNADGSTGSYASGNFIYTTQSYNDYVTFNAMQYSSYYISNSLAVTHVKQATSGGVALDYFSDYYTFPPQLTGSNTDAYYWPRGEWRRFHVDVWDRLTFQWRVEDSVGNMTYLGWYVAGMGNGLDEIAYWSDMRGGLKPTTASLGIGLLAMPMHYGEIPSSSVLWKWKNLEWKRNFRGLMTGSLYGLFSGSIGGTFAGTGSISGAFDGDVSGGLAATGSWTSSSYSGSKLFNYWNNPIPIGTLSTSWLARVSDPNTTDSLDLTYVTGSPVYSGSTSTYFVRAVNIGNRTTPGVSQSMTFSFQSSSLQYFETYYESSGSFSMSAYDGMGNVLATKQLGNTAPSYVSQPVIITSSVPIRTIIVSPTTLTAAPELFTGIYTISTGSSFSGSFTSSRALGLLKGTTKYGVENPPPFGGSGLIVGIPVATFKYYTVDAPNIREGYVGWERTGSPQLSLEYLTQDPSFYLAGDIWTRYRTGSFHSTGSGYRIVAAGGEGISNFVVGDQTPSGEIYSAKILTVRENETSSAQVAARFGTSDRPSASILGVSAVVSDQGFITVNTPENSGSGWYNQTWGGGIYMPSQSIVAIYGNKDFYVSGSITASAYSGTFLGTIESASYSFKAQRLSDVIILTRSLELNTTYQIVMSGSQSLRTGVYDVIITPNDQTHISESYVGMMYWYDDITTSASADEILLHRAGSSPSTASIFLQTRRQGSNLPLVLEMSSDQNFGFTGSYYYTFIRKY